MSAAGQWCASVGARWQRRELGHSGLSTGVGRRGLGVTHSHKGIGRRAGAGARPRGVVGSRTRQRAIARRPRLARQRSRPRRAVRLQARVQRWGGAPLGGSRAIEGWDVEHGVVDNGQRRLVGWFPGRVVGLMSSDIS